MDVFRPKGQLSREIRLAVESPGAVLEILGARLSAERKRRIDEVAARRTSRLTLAIEGVEDPHNTAAIVRTCDAFGLKVVHIIENGTRFLFSRKVTQGAHKWVDLGVWERPEQFAEAVRNEGKRILVACADGSTVLDAIDPSEPMALVVGNEHEGISPAMRALADGAFRIPMHGFVESMNVSVAAAIALAVLRKDGRGDLDPDEAAVLRARFYLRAVRAGYDIVMRELEERGLGHSG